MARPIHFEIHAADPDRARLFYEAVFGWDLTPWGEHGYWVVRTGPPADPGIDGGLVPRRGAEPSAGAPVNAFVCTIAVESLELTVERAIDAGGELVVPRQAVPGIGWHAYLRDTEGNLLGVLQADPSVT